MNISYIKYEISGQPGKQKVIERGYLKLGENIESGRRRIVRQAFPGFEINAMKNGAEDYRMHNEDLTLGIVAKLC